MKSFEVVIQEKTNFCLCSVLQSILKKYNLQFSQEYIASNLTPSKNGFLANDFKIKDFLLKNNFSYNFFYFNETPFNEPDMFLNEMYHEEGIIGIDSHVYILEFFKDPQLNIIDPENGKTIETNLYSILDEMRKREGLFGLIKYLS